MLDATYPFTDLLSAFETWKPDARCLTAGDEYVRLALRCYASALRDGQIVQRVLDLVSVAPPLADDRRDAAIAVARHCALMDLPLRQIIAVLAHLAVEVPGWPDANENAAIAQAAVAEFA